MNESANSKPTTTPKAQVSERKASANRANAQHSTGPRTAAGKARSSLNALRHGILARAAFNLTIEGSERRREFDAIVAGLAQEFQPQTMTEHLMVQQLAGCYWRLAKVWKYEQEAAYRMWRYPNMPMDEFREYNNLDLHQVLLREKAGGLGDFLGDAGLDDPTIPNGASARTVLRYQTAVTSMLFRTHGILERRRKERVESKDPIEERDYINEATEVAAEDEKAEAAEAVAAAAQEAREAEEAKAAKAAASAQEADLHKRTQKAPTDATVSAKPATKKPGDEPASNAASTPNRSGSSGA